MVTTLIIVLVVGGGVVAAPATPAAVANHNARATNQNEYAEELVRSKGQCHERLPSTRLAHQLCG